jgi:hypothetical protein
MEFIIGQNYDDFRIAQNNAWLGEDMVTAAITRKNVRRRKEEASTSGGGGLSLLKMSGETVFVPDDFDIKQASKDDQLEQRRQVTAKIDSMIGWQPTTTESAGGQSDGKLEMPPRRFFDMVTRMIDAHEVKQAQAEPGARGKRFRLRNLTITGHPGTGKKAMGSLIFDFLCAFNVLTNKKAFKRVSVADLQGTGEKGDKSVHAVNKCFQDANGGLLLIHGIDDLLPDDLAGQAAVKANEAARTLMALLMVQIDQFKHNVVVVMSGSREKVNTLMRLTGGLNSRFTYTVDMPLLNSTQLAELAQYTAANPTEESGRDPIEFAPGVLEELARFIEAEDMDKYNKGNARNMMQFLEAALERRESRLVDASFR